MILDTSAVVAVVQQEPGFERVLAELAAEPEPAIGAPTLAECGIVLEAKLGVRGRTLLGRFLQETQTAVLPFDDAHWDVAVEAYARFGKGRHPAGLNFGDCLTYAVASLAGEPLLALGDDFRRTDLAVVELPSDRSG